MVVFEGRGLFHRLPIKRLPGHGSLGMGPASGGSCRPAGSGDEDGGDAVKQNSPQMRAVFC